MIDGSARFPERVEAITLLDGDLRPGRDEIDELLVVARWLLSKRVAARMRVRDVAGTLASALPTVPDYEPPRDAARLRG